MHITSSEIGLSARHVAVEHRESRHQLRAWVGDPAPAGPGARPEQGSEKGGLQRDTLQLSAAAREAQPTKQVAPAESETSSEDELKITLLVKMIESLTGKRLKLTPPGELGERLTEARRDAEAMADEMTKIHRGTTASAEQPFGFGIEYDAYERHYESEKTTFAATGRVTTADGRTIELSLELSMSREFLREQHISLRAGDAQLKDPLVLNFSGNAAELTQKRYRFDIDSDGRAEQIAFVRPESGFLVHDRNRDGKVNDGRELFGPTTGSGFKELAAHDHDANGWIDENDPIYAQLRIWSKDEQGQDQLVALGERGVGAIYLGHVTTPFSVKDPDNSLLGAIRTTGVFLDESGRPGTIQQLDLAV